jgi:glycosyltransferase involved in cell wall biosynthesis
VTTIGLAMSVYNGADTIDAALASVAAQTRRPDQIVVVDDGSSDDSIARILRWQAILPLELVRHATNQGLAAGRTTGIAHLGTDLVLALDADDVWLPLHVELMAAAYAEHPGIVSPNAVAWDPTGVRPVRWDVRLQPRPRAADLEHLLVMNFVFSGSMFERRAFDGVGGSYRFAGCDDWDLWIRLVADGHAPHLIAEPTVLYRVHGENMSGDDRLLETEIAVLEGFLADPGSSADAGARSAAERGLRHRRARVQLRRSYDLAAQQRWWPARAAAVRAWAGPRNVVLRGAAMAVAPNRAIQRRNARTGPR